MNDNSPSDADPFGQIADEFVEAFRRGECPAVEEFARRYPAHADRIRTMLPALVLMEKARSAQDAPPERGPATGAAAAGVLQQLGDYQILREIGRGGMGIVYEAQQISLGRHVALKVLPSRALLNPHQLGRFQREARAAAKLHHTNIVPVFGVGEQDGLHYYVMQFIHGLGLDAVLTELRRLAQPRGQLRLTQDDAPGHPTQGPRDVSAVQVARVLLSGEVFLGPAPPNPRTATFAEREGAAERGTAPPVRAADSSATIHLPGQSEGAALTSSGRPYWQSVARIGMQVAEALTHAASQGILHRDIKPSNLLLDEQGNVWVTDFGLAKADSDGDNLTHTGDIVGTLRYMAPERFDGEGDLRSDVCSLGLTLYELLTLRPAFDESERNRLVKQVMHDEPVRPRKVNAAVPPDLETVVLKAIAREPAHRYQTPTELAEDLQRFVEDRPIQARRVSALEKLRRWSGRNPLPASLLALVVLVFLAGFVGVVWQWRLANAERKDAVVARDEAKRQEALARAAKERAEAALYGSNIVRARLEYRANDVADAEDILDRCEAERRGWEWHFLKHLCHADLLTLEGHTSWVYAVAYSPDGKLLASAGGGNPFWESYGKASIRPGEVILWDAATGARLRILAGHKNVITSVAFSPDGKTLATGSQDDTVRLWDAASGKPLHLLPGRSRLPSDRGYGVSSVAFSPDGKFLAVGSLGKIDLWDLTRPPAAAPVPHSTLQGPDGHWASGMAFSPDGLRLAVAHRITWNGQVKVWNLAQGTEALTLEANTGMVNGVAFSPEGRYLTAWQHQSSVKLWDAATGKRLQTLGGQGSDFFAGAFSPTGDSFAAGSTDGVVRIWSVPAGQEIHLFRGHRGAVRGVAFNASGLRLASGSADGTVKVWDLTQDPEHGLIQQARHQIDTEAIAFADQGNRLVAARRGGILNVLDCDTHAFWSAWPAVPLTNQWLTPAEPACLDAEGRWLAGISRDDPRVAKCWEAATGRDRATLRGHQQALGFVTINPGGARVATAGWADPGASPHTEIKVWDTAEGQPLLQLDEPNLKVTRLALSPDGDRLALAGTQLTPGGEEPKLLMQSVVRVYHVESATVLREFVIPGTGAGEHEPMHALAFSADGARLTAAGARRTVLLWDLVAERPVVTNQGPEEAMDVTFSPDGRRLAIASRLQIKLLDAASGEVVVTLLGRKHLAPDTNSFNPRVRFSPDGQRIAAICHDQLFPIAMWSIKKEADRGPAARLRGADRRAVATLFELAQADARDPRKRAAFVIHLKQLRSVALETAQEYGARGVLSALAGNLDEAEADFARAIKLAPDEAAGLFKVGEDLATVGLWEQAAQYFDRYFTLGQGDSESVCRIACLPLYLSDRATYRHYARRLLERYGQSRDRGEVLRVLLWGVLLSDEGGDPKELLRLADWCLAGGESYRKNHLVILVKGIAEYRAGRFEAAVEWLHKAEPFLWDKTASNFFLSMAYQRLNQRDKANAAYQRALRHITAHFGSADRFTGRKGAWDYWPWCQIFRREAEAVLNNAKGPEKPKE